MSAATLTGARFRARALACLAVLTLVGCRMPMSMPTSMPMPAERTRAPTMEDIQQQMQQKRGRAPTPAPATSDGVQVVFQTGHTSMITTVALSADGRYIASGSQDETVKIWDVASGQETRTIAGYDMLGPRDLGFSSDGSKLFASDISTLKVLDANSGAEVRSYSTFGERPALSADGRTFVRPAVGALAGSQTIDVLDPLTGSVSLSIPMQKGKAERVIAVSGDGTTLLTYEIDLKALQQAAIAQRFDMSGEFHVWDVATHKRRATLPPGVVAINQSIVLSYDGRLLATEKQSDRSIDVYDLSTSAKLQTLATGASPMRAVSNSLVFSRDGTRLAWASSENHAFVWNVATGQIEVALDASAVAFGADDHTLVLGRDAGGAPFLHDLTTGSETMLAGGGTGVEDIALAPGNTVVTSMDNGAARQWDLATGQLMRSFECASRTGAAHSVAVSSAQPLLAIGCMDGATALWDMKSGTKIRDLSAALPAGTWAFTSVRFSADGRLLVLGRKDRVALYDVATGQEINALTMPPSTTPDFMRKLAGNSEAPTMFDNAALMEQTKIVNAVAIHGNGDLVAVARTYDVSLWNLRTGQLVRHLTGGGATPALLIAASSTPQPANADQLKALMKSLKQKGKAPQAIVANDPSEVLDAMQEQTEGSRSLAFSADGRYLMMLGNSGPRVWDVASGAEIRRPQAHEADDSNDANAFMDRETGGGQGAAFSPDGRLGARGHGRMIEVWEIGSGKAVAELAGHTSDVTSVAFAAGGKLLVSGGRDGAVRVWNVAKRQEAAALIALGGADYVAVTPDQYYRASKSRIKGVAFRVNDQLYPFEQFDLRFNRPDIVLERLGLASSESVQSYRQAYQRRLKKLGFTEAMLGADFHLPTATLVANVPVATDAATLPITVRASDDKYALDRLQVFVNDVPIYGSRGIAIDGDAHAVVKSIAVPLVAGRNKVQVSVLNREGAESLKQTAYTNATGTFPAGDVYVVAIGVSHYANAAYNLRYAAKDAGDFASAYASTDSHAVERGAVHVLELTNEHATRDEIRRAKSWLGQAKVGDLAIVFAAGHGMTDVADDYYFGTYDIDPKNPSARGLPYEDFEALLDGIAPLRKMLLIDTCFSGEIDKDDAVVVARADTSTLSSNDDQGQVKMRAFKSQRGVHVVADDTVGAAGALESSALRFQQDWFADLRRGTGAVVISSASGNEYAFEGEQWKNGVFTYALLRGLSSGAADADRDSKITVGELQAFVIDQVRKLTAGGQNPTVRRENLDYDFRVY